MSHPETSRRDRLLEAAIQMLPFGVVVHDGGGRCILANDSAHRLWDPTTMGAADSRFAVPDAASNIVRSNGRAVDVCVRAIRSDHEEYALTTLVEISGHDSVQRELLTRAFNDPLTGLPNRSLFEQSVRDLIETTPAGGLFALAFIDLDGFSLINEIIIEVLAQTVRSMKDIDETFGPDVSVSINIAAKQACDVAFMSSFCDTLASTGYAERFILELTEEAFFTKSRFQTEVLPRVRAVGARVSIDDFGLDTPRSRRWRRSRRMN